MVSGPAGNDQGMTQESADAVVIGAGPNGLVAACILADAGWDVVVLEAADEVGGAVKSERRVPGYVHDMYSSFYPLAAASPVLAKLGLDDHGLRWRHAPAVVAHLLSPDAEQAAVLHRDPAETAALLEADARGDGDAWLRLFEHWQRIRDPLLDALFSPFPPVKAGAALFGRLGVHDLLWTLRMFALPVHRLGQELFKGQMGPALITGNALHADVPAVAPVSGVFGWLLVMLGQDVGFPVPEGGAGMLTQALASRARSAGAVIRTGARVERVVVGNGKALGVVAADGTAVRARRAVLADVPAPTLLGSLVARDQVPPRLLEALERFQWDLPTVKVNWALDGPIPWKAAGASQAGTVHLGSDAEGLALSSAALDLGRPAFPGRAPGPGDRPRGPSPPPRPPSPAAGGLSTTPPGRARGPRPPRPVPPPVARASGPTATSRGGSTTGRPRRRWPSGWTRPSRRTHPASTTGSWSAGSSCRRTWSPMTPRSSTARSTAGRRSSTSS